MTDMKQILNNLLDFDLIKKMVNEKIINPQNILEISPSKFLYDFKYKKHINCDPNTTEKLDKCLNNGKNYSINYSEFGNFLYFSLIGDCKHYSNQYPNKNNNVLYSEGNFWKDENILDIEIYAKQYKDDKYERRNFLVSINKVINTNENKGTYYFGENQIGKTYTNKMVSKWFLKQNKTIVFTSVNNLVYELKKDFNQENNNKTQLDELCKKTDALFLDDIGGEFVSKWTIEQLFTILNFRLENKKPTFFTSNYSLKELLSKYVIFGAVDAKRLISRIIALTVQVRSSVKGNLKYLSGGF